MNICHRVSGSDFSFRSIERCEEISTISFLENFIAKNKPVIWPGAMKGSQALQDWSLEFFLKRYGDKVVSVSSTDGTTKSILLGEYIRSVLSEQFDPGYLRDLRLDKLDPSLLESIANPLQFSTDFLDHHPKTRNALKWLYIGGRGTGTPLHIDVWKSQSWMFLIEGRKKWFMLPPFESDLDSAPPSLNGDELSSYLREHHPSEALEFELLPGELVYVPSGWWHAVENQETSLAVTFNFVDSYSLDGAYAAGAAHQALLDSIVSRETEELRATLRSATTHNDVHRFNAQALAAWLEKKADELERQACLLKANSRSLTELL